MIVQYIQAALRRLGYEIHRVPRPSSRARQTPVPVPPPIAPAWPLPRCPRGPSDGEIRRAFAKHDLWHYAYEFEGGLAFSTRHNDPDAFADEPRRPLQRFAHFMPYLVQAENGTLQGKRILDIACNSGFWSFQCALLGAEVVGFDVRPELIDQAKLVQSIVGLGNVEFRVLDFWDMSAESLGGTFDVVLNLGALYHLPNPLDALDLTKAMARRHVLLDTAVHPSVDAVVKLRWEEPSDIRSAGYSGVVAYPSKGSIDLMLRHIGADDWFEIPVHSTDMPGDYLQNKRASWLIRV